MYRAQLTIMSAIGMLALSAPIALADSGENYSMHGMGAGGWIFGPLMMILMIALILNERFARGEIDPEEFENRKRALDK